MEILFNNEGDPLVMNSTYMFADTYTDRSAINQYKEKNILMPHEMWRHDYLQVDDYKVVAWGKDNLFPQLAEKVIAETTVLNTGLRFLWQLILGQGIFACHVTGYDEKGNEQLEPVEDAKVQRWLEGRMCRKYCEKVLRDYLKVGNGAVQFVPGLSLDKLNGLNSLNALWYRYTESDEYGNRTAIVSGKWPVKPSEYKAIPVLNDYNPEAQAEIMKFRGNMKNGFIYPVRDSWSSEECYGEPRWWPAFIAGWVDIAHLVPKFLKKAFQNQTTWKWHVQIPYSYWEKKFPKNDEKYVKDPNLRKKDINDYMDSIERNLLGPENSEKPIFSNYAVNEMNGKIEEEWKITPLANKYNGNDNLVTSAGANSEILFSLALNPAIFGAIPGGSYSQNLGGSNIREAFLVNIANSWIERQNILDPLELYMKLNGMGEDVELRFRNTILTTLDTGAGTKKELS